MRGGEKILLNYWQKKTEDEGQINVTIRMDTSRNLTSPQKTFFGAADDPKIAENSTLTHPPFSHTIFCCCCIENQSLS